MYRNSWLLLAISLMLVTHGSATLAADDAADTRKRSEIAKIKRIAVIPPFFGTETLRPTHRDAEDTKESTKKGTKESKKSDHGINEETRGEQGEEKETRGEQGEEIRKSDDEMEAKQPPKPASLDPGSKRYLEYLKKLEEHAQSYLPERLAKRMKFEVLSASEVATGLKKLDLSPQTLFENRGLMKGTRFPLPKPDMVRKLAEALKVDSLVMGVLDEPRRANGKYFFDPLYGFYYERGNVEAHGGFYLMSAAGTEVVHGYMRVRSPLSRANNGRDFALPDWIDVQELMIENMMDEWSYFQRK